MSICPISTGVEVLLRRLSTGVDVLLDIFITGVEVLLRKLKYIYNIALLSAQELNSSFKNIKNMRRL